jgi:hypothetical protein
MIIDKNSTLEYLKIKITDHLEHFPEYNNIHGLKVTNLRKKAEKGYTNLNQNGEIKEFLNDGDIVHCDVLTTEFWIPTKVRIENSFQVIRAKFDLKVNLETSLESLKYTMLKSLLNFYKEKLLSHYIAYHYIINDGFIEVINGEDKTRFSLSDNPGEMIRYKNNKVKKTKDIIDFTTKMSCHIRFVSLEELIFDEFKIPRFNNLEADLNEAQKLNWNEFRAIDFSDFTFSLKFINETKVIKKIVQRHCQRSHSEAELFNFNYDFSDIGSASGEDEQSVNIF